MDITTKSIITILFIHFIADFVLQTDKQAKGKSSNIRDLVSHTIIYSSCYFIIPLFMYLKDFKPYNGGLSNEDYLFYSIYIPKLLIFILVTFICHTITDYFTSRLNKKLWNKKEVHNFFVSVGFDQFLHHLQLILTFYFLTNN